MTGEAIVGKMTGTRLQFLPAPVISWGVFREAFPDGQLLSRYQGFYSDYSTPPYFGYDAADNTPFLFFGNVDPRLPAMERVVSVTIDGVSAAYPFMLLRNRPAINDSVNGRDLAVFYVGGIPPPRWSRDTSQSGRLIGNLRSLRRRPQADIQLPERRDQGR